jgi:urease accessory protein
MNAATQEGRLDLRFALGSSGRTELVRRAQRFPLHLTVPLYLDERRPGMAFVYVQNPTGGVFAGDRLETNVVAGHGTSVHLTTTAATKLYRMEEGKAFQRIALEVGRDAYLEYLPEPLIPQAGSRFEQETEVALGEGAVLVLGETLAPGRLARGEVFAFDQLLLRTRIRGPTQELCAETVLLEPLRVPLDRRGVLGRYRYVATLLAIAPGWDASALADRLDARVREVAGALGSAGELPCEAGAVVRILAHSAGPVRSALNAAWQAARELLLGQPPPRRRK